MVAVLVLIGVALVWQFSHRYVKTRSLSSMQEVLTLQRAELDRQLDQLSFIAKILADDVEIRTALLAPESQSLQNANERLRQTQIDSGLEFAFLLNPDGITIAASNYRDSVSFVGIGYSFRPYFKQAIQGVGATYFAVGATTGIPGYFIAWPVIDDNEVLGVVVTKMNLQLLVNTSVDKEYSSILTDEFGVVILSTDENMLYMATRSMTEEQKQNIDAERRYVLNDGEFLAVSDQPNQHRWINNGVSTDFLLVEEPLFTEPWSLSSMVTLRRVYQGVMFLVLSICAVLIILYLLLRIYSQQQRLMLAQQRNAQELEDLVEQRTVELASAQKRLIAESNFSMLGRMSAAINHEVNQPLASLRFNLASLRKLISQEVPDEQEIEQIVIDSDRTTKRIGRVINSLRSIASRGDREFRSFSLDRVVYDVLDTVKRERPILSAFVNIADDLPKIRILGEEVLIQQAILNLLYNAFDAVVNVESPSITLQLTARDGLALSFDKLKLDENTLYACLSVTDNGAGVDSDIADSLFEPFTSGRGLADGLGLGLTISLQIAHDHAGELIHYQKPGQTGSCFMLIVPHE